MWRRRQPRRQRYHNTTFILGETDDHVAFEHTRSAMRIITLSLSKITFRDANHNIANEFFTFGDAESHVVIDYTLFMMQIITLPMNI